MSVVLACARETSMVPRIVHLSAPSQRATSMLSTVPRVDVPPKPPFCQG